METFINLNLDPKILKTLNSIGFTQPTPIQSQAIPKALAGADIIATAQTGTGKTGAFLIPALNNLAKSGKSSGRGPRVLVLVPTRELAEQVAKESIRFGKHLPQVTTVCIYGGMPYPKQNRELSRPYEILVATPGRLIDHLERGRIDLSRLEYFVLDEADRMLDMGFIHDVEKIAAAAPESRQTLLFSATIDRNVRKISQKLQKNPEEILIETPKADHGRILQQLYYVDNVNHKVRLLETLLDNPELKQAIVFTSTKVQADKLCYSLQDKGYQTAPLHGDISQNKRNHTLKGLRSGRIQILVATDVAARGIDVASLSHVFNFDLPRQAEDFVHRIGRTGRAGASGVAISFATYSEKKVLAEIDKIMGKQMDICTIEGLEPKVQPKQTFDDASRKSKRPFRNHRFGGPSPKPGAKRTPGGPKRFQGSGRPAAKRFSA